MAENTVLRRQYDNSRMAARSRYKAERTGGWLFSSFWNKGGLNQSSAWGNKEKKILNPLKERIYKTWSQDQIQGIKIWKLGMTLNMSYFLCKEKILLPNSLTNGPFIMLPIPGSIISPTKYGPPIIFTPVRMKYVILFCVFKNDITFACKSSLFFLTPISSINLIYYFIGKIYLNQFWYKCYYSTFF